MLDGVRSSDARGEAAVDDLAGLLAFRRLDLLLATGVMAARHRYGPEAASDSFRGLYLSEEQVQRGLLEPPATPLASVAARGPVPGPVPEQLPGWPEIEADNPGWRWLRRRYGLDERELDILLVAIGPEVDRRYERLYGYLQDDVSARRPTVSLALDLLATSPTDGLGWLDLFAPDSALVRHRLLVLPDDPRMPGSSLIARPIAVDGQIAAAILGLDGIDSRLAAFCRVVRPGETTAPDDELSRAAVEHAAGTVSSVAALVQEAWGRRPLRLCFRGPVGTGRRQAAYAVAAQLGLPLLVVDGPRLAGDPAAISERLSIVFRDAELRAAMVYLDGADALFPDSGRAGADDLAAALAIHRGVIMLSTTRSWAPSAEHPLGVLTVEFGPPEAAVRRAIWTQALTAAGGPASSEDVSLVADRFRLSPGQIQDAALTATTAARLRGGGPDGDAGLSRDELFAAARRQRGHDLTAFARRVHLLYGWDDLVVPEDVLRQLHELTARLEHRSQVLEEWGFERKLSGGKGITALFAGPSGTGKTMAAAVIAAELGLDLYAIDLSTVVSKYIGETEKNLARVFAAAADTDAVLFFDEADALFGKRSEVRDAHDRYANIEIAYLLQQMEQYDGLAILATNLRHHLDDAFTRRLQFEVDFPFPDVADRLRIWQTCLPSLTPLDPDADLTELAGFRLAGGNIRNIALGAAYLAAADGTPVGRRHLLDATRREFQKMGKVLADLEPPSAAEQ